MTWTGVLWSPAGRALTNASCQTPNTLFFLILSLGDIDDRDQPPVHPGHAGIQNLLYLTEEEKGEEEEVEDEEDEDGEEVEQGQEGRKVTVRNNAWTSVCSRFPQDTETVGWTWVLLGSVVVRKLYHRCLDDSKRCLV